MHDDTMALPGPGSGGSPAPSTDPTPDERAEAASDPEVAALLTELRDGEADDPAAEVPIETAAEQAGTGTDR